MPSGSIEQSSGSGSGNGGGDANIMQASGSNDASSALFDSAYDFGATASAKEVVATASATGDNLAVQAAATAEPITDQTATPSVGKDAAFRIMSDLKKIEDARVDQQALFNPTTVLSSLGAIAVGVANVFDTVGVSAVLAAVGTGSLIFETVHGLKDGADWKAAGEDIDATFDQLLQQRSDGSLSTGEVEHFATLMHDLPDKPLSEILNEDQLEKYRRLIAGSAKHEMFEL